MSTGNNAIAGGIIKFGEHINKAIGQHNQAAMNIHAIALNHHFGALRDQQAHENNLESMGKQHVYNTKLTQTKGDIASNLEAQKHKQTMAQNRQLSKIQFTASEQAHMNATTASDKAHRQAMSKTRAITKLAEPGSQVDVAGVGKFNTALPKAAAPEGNAPAERAPRNRGK